MKAARVLLILLVAALTSPARVAGAEALPSLPVDLDQPSVTTWLDQATAIVGASPRPWAFDVFELHILWPTWWKDIVERTVASPAWGETLRSAMVRGGLRLDLLQTSSLVDLVRIFPISLDFVAPVLRARGELQAVGEVLRADKPGFRDRGYFEVCAQLGIDPPADVWKAWLVDTGNPVEVFEWFLALHPDEGVAWLDRIHREFPEEVDRVSWRILSWARRQTPLLDWLGPEPVMVP